MDPAAGWAGGGRLGGALLQAGAPAATDGLAPGGAAISYRDCFAGIKNNGINKKKGKM